MKTILTAILNVLASLNPAVRLVLGLGTVLLAVNTYINSLWTTLFARVDALAATAAGSANFSPVGLINYFVPLDSILTFIAAYATLRLACAGIRIVKSFIPSIA